MSLHDRIVEGRKDYTPVEYAKLVDKNLAELSKALRSGDKRWPPKKVANALDAIRNQVKKALAEDEALSEGKHTPEKRLKMISQHALAAAAAIRDLENEIADPDNYTRKLGQKARSAVANIQQLAH